MANYSSYYQPIQPRFGSYDDQTSNLSETPAGQYGGSDPYMLQQNSMSGADPHAEYMSSLGGGSSGAAAPASNMAGIAGAGIGAAGQTIGTLAQVIAQSQARQQALADAGLDRDSSMQLAKLRLKANAELADKERTEQARNMIVQALTKQGANAITAWDTNRGANQAGSSLVARAFM